MFDPLSALSCIGFAIGVVGFLATTLSKLDEGFDKVRECREILLHLSLQLEDGHLQLKAWRSIWISEPKYEDQLYVYLWGQEGFDDVQTRLRSLLDLSIRIRTLLRWPASNERENNLSPAERLEWHKFLGQEVFETSDRSGLNDQKLNLLRRIGFSLFGNAALQDKIGRFNSQVQGLDDFSMRMFRLLQSGDPNTRVSPKEVRELAGLKLFIDRASIFGSSVYESSRWIPGVDATLEISPPEEDQALHLWNEVDDLHLDLLIILNAAPKRKAGRFRITQRSTAQTPRDEVLELLKEACLLVLDGITVNINPTRGISLAELECPSSRSRPFRKMLIDGVLTSKVGKSFDMERADLIYGLAHWFIHFWNTPWVVYMCSCNIRQVHFPESRTRHSLAAGPATVTCHSGCRPIQMADQRLTLLGKTLAEAALAVPIGLEFEGGELKFRIDTARKSREDLLADLANRHGRTNITKAIRYCLDPAHADPKRFLPEHMEPFCQNILQP